MCLLAQGGLERETRLFEDKYSRIVRDLNNGGQAVK